MQNLSDKSSVVTFSTVDITDVIIKPALSIRELIINEGFLPGNIADLIDSGVIKGTDRFGNKNRKPKDEDLAELRSFLEEQHNANRLRQIQQRYADFVGKMCNTGEIKQSLTASGQIYGDTPAAADRYGCLIEDLFTDDQYELSPQEPKPSGSEVNVRLNNTKSAMRSELTHYAQVCIQKMIDNGEAHDGNHAEVAEKVVSMVKKYAVKLNTEKKFSIPMAKRITCEMYRKNGLWVKGDRK